MVARAGRRQRRHSGRDGQGVRGEGDPGKRGMQRTEPLLCAPAPQGSPPRTLVLTGRDSGGVFTATLQMQKWTLGRLGNLPAGVM